MSDLRETLAASQDTPETEGWYWIQNSGSCPQEALPGLVQAFRQPGDRAAAFYTDCFQGADSGHIPALLEAGGAEPDPLRNLLELRVFRKDAEFWAHRTGVNAPFSWRVADDAALREKVRERNPDADPDAVMERYTISTKQLLDISPEYEPYRNGETDAFGCRKLRSSAGGTYALPLGGERRYGYALLVNYVSYDQDGIAGIADFRLAGFAPL